jgi:probable F420-dependent oxidoreductase
MRLDASLGFETRSSGCPRSHVRRGGRRRGLWTAETSHDPFLPLTLAAEHTERLELGTAIAVAFARSPIVTAATAWDLARQSRGRFLLGLGSQVRAHIERRFGMAWSGRPVAQLREYVAVVRAAWEAWQSGTRPTFRGEFYRFTLMSPVFDPGPIDHPDIPIYLAGVGAGMTRLAGEVGDGLIVHPLHSRSYLSDVVIPAVTDGARAVGRDPGDVTIAASVIVATNEEEIAEARRTIGFYASTRRIGACSSSTAGAPPPMRWRSMRGAAAGRHSPTRSMTPCSTPSPSWPLPASCAWPSSGAPMGSSIAGRRTRRSEGPPGEDSRHELDATGRRDGRDLDADLHRR